MKEFTEFKNTCKSNKFLNVIEKCVTILESTDVDYEQAILYGSCARNDMTYKSDVDIAIIAEDSVREALCLRWDLSGAPDYSAGEPEVDVHVIPKVNFELDTIYNNLIKKEGVILCKRKYDILH